MAILLSAVFTIGMLCAATIVNVGGHLVESQQAQLAANAAALAAIHDERFAEKIASQNGGDLVLLEDHRELDGTVSVQVRVGSMMHKAKAFDTWHDTTSTLES